MTVKLSMLFLLALTLPQGGQAEQFDPEKLSQSTVKIFIKQSSKTTASATGFVWQQPDQVVTSLHVLSGDKDSRIIVEFEGKKRIATVKSLLPNADLVLLKVKKPPQDWVALQSFNSSKPKYKAEVAALGYHRGAAAMSTRDLRKGYVKPEVLLSLLPPDAAKKLSSSALIDLRLPIYYLDGSLLPGYSGAPIVDQQGQLIGVGNGGLENGAASVSWVIPASNLDQLVKSADNTLPKELALVNKTFSADLHQADAIEQLSALEPQSALHKVSWLPWGKKKSSDHFTQVDYQQFSFVKTRNRRYKQMLMTSSTPELMEKVSEIAHHFFPGFQVDPWSFVFDVYEDSHHGLNIVVPYGTELKVEDGEYLLAQGDLFCQSCPYEIQYHVRKMATTDQQLLQNSPEKFLDRLAQQHWQELNEEDRYGEYKALRVVEQFGGHRYVLRSVYSNFDSRRQAHRELNYYAAASNNDIWFQAEGILNRFDDLFAQQLAKHRGTNCEADNLGSEQSALCEDIRTMYKILISIHLTSFSNKIMASATP